MDAGASKGNYIIPSWARNTRHRLLQPWPWFPLTEGLSPDIKAPFKCKSTQLDILLLVLMIGSRQRLRKRDAVDFEADRGRAAYASEGAGAL